MVSNLIKTHNLQLMSNKISEKMVMANICQNNFPENHNKSKISEILVKMDMVNIIQNNFMTQQMIKCLEKMVMVSIIQNNLPIKKKTLCLEKMVMVNICQNNSPESLNKRKILEC